MPEIGNELVINTGPVIALVAALGDLRLLKDLYTRILVPREVCEELTVSNASHFAAREFDEANWLEKQVDPVRLHPLLKGILDPGEAAVIQLAGDRSITTVCIDESVGRRVARMSGLRVTGSLGILLRAKRNGHVLDLHECVKRMRDRNIYLGESLVSAVLKLAGERPD